MSLMSNATPPPPAEKGPAIDPKADATAAAKPDGSTSAADGDTTGASPAGSSPSTTTTKTPPSKAQQDFEAKLEELAKLDLSVKQQAKEVAKAKAQLERYLPLDEHLTKGELRAAAKKFFGQKYTPELLLELADDFAPEEVSVEERVKRTLDAERKAADDKAKKEADDKAANEKAAVETETKAYLTATADHLRKNQAKYPLICAWDDDPDIDHEKIIDRTWRDHYAKTGQVLDPDKVLEIVEASHLARIKKTSFGPKEQREQTLEEHAGVAARPAPSAAPPPPNGRPKTGVEEAYANLEAYEREQRQRALLSYDR